MKYKHWEMIAVDLIYMDKEPVTLAVLPRDTELGAWMDANIKRSPGEHRFVYTYNITVH
jgi:hypothetical protein